MNFLAKIVAAKLEESLQLFESGMTATFKAAIATPKMQQWGKDNYYVLSGKTGAEAAQEFAKLESLFAWTLWDLGAAKVDPATLGIPKP